MRGGDGGHAVGPFAGIATALFVRERTGHGQRVDTSLLGGLGTPIRLSDTPFQARAASPPFARHTRTALAELRYDERETDELAARGAVVLEPSEEST